MLQMLKNLTQQDLAVSAVEYAMLLALIGLVTVAAMVGLGEQIATRMNTTASTIQTP